MTDVIATRSEPTDVTSPEWPDELRARFAGMTAWAVRLEAEMDWRLTDQARELMWELASLLDSAGYLTVDEVPRDEIAALTTA